MEHEYFIDMVNVSESQMKKFTAFCNKISRNLKKYGIEGEVTALNMGYHMDDIPNSRARHKVFDMYVAFPKIDLGDWKILATIEHSPEANIVYFHTNDNIENRKELFSVKPSCDHCDTNRRRKTTYIIQNVQNKEIKQIGKSCARDFFDVDVNNISAFEQLIKCSKHLADAGFSEYISSNGNYFVYDLDMVIDVAIKTISMFGFHTANQHNSTKADIYDQIINNANPPVLHTKPKFTVEDIINYWKTNNSDTDFSLNAKSLIERGYVKPNHFGLLAAMVGICMSENDQNKNSEYVGKIGEKFSGKVVLLSRSVVNTPRFRGVVNRLLYNGNMITAFGGAFVNVQKGAEVEIDGKVCRHSDYRGEKQTTINYVKLVEH